MNWSILSKVHLRYSLITQKNVCDFKKTLGITRFASRFQDPLGRQKRMSSVKHIVNDTFSRNGAIFGAGGIMGYFRITYRWTDKRGG